MLRAMADAIVRCEAMGAVFESAMLRANSHLATRVRHVDARLGVELASPVMLISHHALQVRCPDRCHPRCEGDHCRMLYRFTMLP